LKHVYLYHLQQVNASLEKMMKNHNDHPMVE
jgi:hypothetical protein